MSKAKGRLNILIPEAKLNLVIINRHLKEIEYIKHNKEFITVNHNLYDISDIPPAYPCMKIISIEMDYLSTAIIQKPIASTIHKLLIIESVPVALHI